MSTEVETSLNISETVRDSSTSLGMTRTKIAAPVSRSRSGSALHPPGHGDLRVLNAGRHFLAAGKKKKRGREGNWFCSQDRHLPGSTSTQLCDARNRGFPFASRCGVRNLKPDAGIGSLRCGPERSGQDFGA